jgi:hypothetical protein
MGHDEGNRFLPRPRHAIPEKCLHRSPQGIGGIGIELSGHGRRPDAVAYTAGETGRDNDEQTNGQDRSEKEKGFHG